MSIVYDIMLSKSQAKNVQLMNIPHMVIPKVYQFPTSNHRYPSQHRHVWGGVKTVLVNCSLV